MRWRGSSLSHAAAKASMPRAMARAGDSSSHSRISAFCRRIACGPPASTLADHAADRPG